MIACLVIPGFELRAALRERPRLQSEPAALASFQEALAKLATEDEVAVFASRDWFVGEPK